MEEWKGGSEPHGRVTVTLVDRGSLFSAHPPRSGSRFPCPGFSSTWLCAAPEVASIDTGER